MEGHEFVVRRDVPVPMRDGVRLFGDLYMPAEDGRCGGVRWLSRRCLARTQLVVSAPARAAFNATDAGRSC
jgi:predicted acyl esterase